MQQQLLLTVIFCIALACVPFLVRWLKFRIATSSKDGGQENRFISAVAVGPNQKIVTVEVGPEHDRVWLTLGVSVNNIACLHTTKAPMPPEDPLLAQTIPGKLD